MSVILEIFRKKLGPKPRASNDCSKGLIELYRRDALKNVYIEHSPKASQCWLIVDIDEPDALDRIEDSRLPTPNMVVLNPKNGHAHAYWLLESPVYKTGRARQHPYSYFKAIWRGFTRRIGGDLGYVRLITKNPFNARWKTICHHFKAFSLEELNDYLDPIEKRKITKEVTIEDGAGRNVALFNTLRIEAYSYTAKLKRAGLNSSDLHQWALQRGVEINASFPIPLPHKEVFYTINSICEYCWEKIKADYRNETFSEMQRRRVNIRWAKYRLAKIKRFPATWHTGRVFNLIGIKATSEPIIPIRSRETVSVPQTSFRVSRNMLQHWPPE